MGDANDAEEQRSMRSFKSVQPEPDTMTKIVKRIRVMTYKLLPVEVDVDDITDPTSSIITPDVIKAYAKCGGDFSEAIPFCLLRAKSTFLRDANRNPADYDENLCRSIACETLARRIVHDLPVDRLESVMSTRYRYREADGDESSPVSALETAVDQDAIIFLSSSEAQHVINSLWRGEWIQDYHANDQIDYQPYDKQNSKSFWDHLNPHRLAVPRYQNAVQTPLENQPAQRLDWLEVLLYVLASSFFVDVNFAIHSLLLTALGFRIASLYYKDDKYADQLHLRSYQILSTVAPLIWMSKDHFMENDCFKIIGVMQIVVFSRDSAIFFILLAIMGAGFAQALFALDAADGQVNAGSLVWNGLLQALLGSPDFDTPSERFRGPDTYVYPAPLNLVEIVIAPLEYVLPHNAWDRLNKFVMSTLLFVPLVLIAFFESTLNATAHQRLKLYFSDDILEDEDDPELQDPETGDGEQGVISTEKFADLVKVFPNTAVSSSSALSQELAKIQKQVAELQEMLKRQNGKA
ncbi:hypothetical protein QFC24_005145 [Naganishia onofrii]|uniref:Uncharacterized protein n=1 Tax=Naganishia onofrii TaxID=1851511 RepID=A0ACC2X993_9TREE|nr:hypothetical protein QFC24_005145 [Naganishia onofrii]